MCISVLTLWCMVKLQVCSGSWGQYTGTISKASVSLGARCSSIRPTYIFNSTQYGEITPPIGSAELTLLRCDGHYSSAPFGLGVYRQIYQTK